MFTPDSRLDMYGFKVVDKHRSPNKHEPPGNAILPEFETENTLYSDLTYGPIVVVLRVGTPGTAADLSAQAYCNYINLICGSESIYSDETRSTDGSDNGSDLDDFIVPDDCE